MNIFLLTSVYPSEEAAKGTTPVVHYFAKEWAAAGHNVRVLHTQALFPSFFYLIGRLFGTILYSKFGFAVSSRQPKEYDEIKDGVKVSHLVIRKKRPHGRFSRAAIQKAFDKIMLFVTEEGVPDCFVGHWDNPQLELLHLLKDKNHRPTCLVYHNNQFDGLYKVYGEETESLVKDVDLVGFRNITAKTNYEALFGKSINSFIAASGVSKPFIDAGNRLTRVIDKVQSFVYVGTLINRKYPTSIIDSLHSSFQNDFYKITFIGEGRDKSQIQRRFNSLGCTGELCFTGKIPREDVIQYLERSDVFVMISKGEIFGLVYLEAMALGCITIASRNEGIDGIIEDGVNGFLCEAGNSTELGLILSKIRNMSPQRLHGISERAKQTARYYSDVNVSRRYLEELNGIISKAN